MTLSVDLSATDHVPEGDPIRGAADALLTQVKTLQATVQDLSSEWTALPGIYADTDHDDQLYSAFTDPDADVDDVVSMARGLKAAAHTAADEFDAIRSARNTIKTVDLPAAQSRYDAAVGALDDPSDEDLARLKSTYEAPLQRSADDLVTRLTEAETTYSSAVDTAMAQRPGRAVKAHFSYGTHDPKVIEAQRLHEKAMAPGAGAADITAYYEHLAGLTPEQIEALGARHPQIRTTAPPLPTTEGDLAGWPGGAEGAAWWQGLTTEQQAALVLALPGLVGNTEGVPYTDRAAANAETLDLLDQDPALSADHRNDLKNIREALENPQQGERYLISLRHDDAQEHVLGALSIGNPDTADTVTWRVPGMGAETNGAPGMMDELQHIYDQTSGSRATVLWVGYDTPDGAHHRDTLGSSQVLSNEPAYQGAIPLAHALDSFQETRRANAQYVAGTWNLDQLPQADPQVNVAAHSYGTPTAAYALTMTEHQVDTYVMYGSVGVDPDYAPNAQALNVARDAQGNPEVYATQARGDMIAVPLGQTLSPFGGEQRISPTDDAWGAKVFSSDGGPGENNLPTTGHMGVEPEGNGYTEPGTQSLNSIAAILDGNGHLVDQIDQSWWDDLREDPASVIMEKPHDWVDRHQSDARAWVDGHQSDAQDWANRQQRHIQSGVDLLQGVTDRGIDAWQENQRWVPDAPIDWMQDRGSQAVDAVQRGADRLTDGLQTGVDYAVDSVQNGADRIVDGLQDGAEDVVRSGTDWLQETWPEVVPYGEKVYEAFEEDGFPGWADRTVDAHQEDLRGSVDETQDGVNTAVDTWQRYDVLAPDAAVDWVQKKGNETVDAAQDTTDRWIDDGQRWFHDALDELVP